MYIYSEMYQNRLNSNSADKCKPCNNITTRSWLQSARLVAVVDNLKIYKVAYDKNMTCELDDFADIPYCACQRQQLS